MIIARSPLRISLGGGGTDLPSYYRDHEGFVISAAIDKSVYVTLHQTFISEMILKYSKMERVGKISEIQHPIIRECLKLTGIDTMNLEITSMADIPAGSGLGSSGSFTTALLKVLHAYKKDLIHPQELAAEACHVELDLLSEPIGKQDQYIAAYGGITCFRFLPDGKVEAKPLKVAAETIHAMEDNLLLFFTGYSRSAGAILKDQDDKTKLGDSGMLENLHFIKDLGLKSRSALEAGDLRGFAELMNIHWTRKKARSPNMTRTQIDDWYELARKNGALGGKLIGAGGGGFLLFYSEDQARLREAMRKAGLSEVRFKFDFEGTKVII